VRGVQHDDVLSVAGFIGHTGFDGARWPRDHAPGCAQPSPANAPATRTGVRALPSSTVGVACMKIIVWNIPESCSEQEVRDFLTSELGHYAKDIEVHEQGTSNAYANIEVDAEESYVADMIARQFNGKMLGGVALQVSAVPFDDEESPHKKDQSNGV